MKILVIHHLQKIWHGYDFYDICQEAIEHIEDGRYDKVILTQFEVYGPSEEYYEAGIADYIDEWHNYDYGWILDGWTRKHYKKGVDYCPGGTHSQIVMLDDWIKDLKGHDVYICGAFDGECLDDLETALEFLKIEYTRVEQLIL